METEMQEERKEGSCSFCGNDFRIEALQGGKCPSCAVNYKGFNTLEEYQRKNQPRIKSQLMNEDSIREMIYEILAEFGFERKLCEKCGKTFSPKSPAAKQCDECRAKTKENK